MRPAEIGVAASLGRDVVRTIRRPTVAIISTGDELMSPGSPPEPGKIYNSNAFSIAAMAEDYGGEPRVMGIAKDTIEALSEILDASIDCDMVVTSAGVSKGDYDVVKDVLAKRGAITLWSVRMRPAKPLAFGTLDGPNGRKVPHLGLPRQPGQRHGLRSSSSDGRPCRSCSAYRCRPNRLLKRSSMTRCTTTMGGAYTPVWLSTRPRTDRTGRAPRETRARECLLRWPLQTAWPSVPTTFPSYRREKKVTVEMIDWPNTVF